MTKKNICNCIDCKEGWANFKVLTEEELELLEKSRYEATFRPGEMIVKQSSPASNAVFLRSGLAKIYMEGQGQKNLIINIVKPGKMIVGPGVYTDLRHSYSVSSIDEVKACFVSVEVIKELSRQNKDFADGIMKEISLMSNFYLNKLLSMTQKKMPGRVAEILLYLANEVFCSDEFKPLLTRHEMADMAGMAKESIVRILKDFSNEGIICSDCPEIKILKKETLEMISENG
ncbi:MAG: Crp/Fnr family transcriptional regulator [Bacteroidales bacterium]|nr:Crp/Fnr family transcriptional regulator [Bacteroidales bacterium]